MSSTHACGFSSLSSRTRRFVPSFAKQVVSSVSYFVVVVSLFSFALFTFIDLDVCRAFVSAPLPLGVSDAKDRLVACHASNTSLKQAPTAVVQLWFQNNVLGLLPKFLVRKTAFDVISRHTLVMSNVPGPDKPVYFCDTKLLGVHFIYPNALPQFDVISYNGAVFSNINVDVAVVQDPSSLTTYFMEEFVDLATALDVPCSMDDMVPPGVSGSSTSDPSSFFGVASLS